VTFAAATPLECKALRRVLPDARIIETGIGMARAGGRLDGIVISFGLAGALRPDLPTGTLLIPREVGCQDGERLRCDPEVVEVLAASARNLRIEPVFDALLTANAIVSGAQRARWAAQGYAGVDMETGRIQAPRVAAIRVVLDTPTRELASDWQTPALAILNPRNWPQALWLAREAPRMAALAARVVAGAQGIGSRVRITGQ
jgi:hypothetical protein